MTLMTTVTCDVEGCLASASDRKDAVRLAHDKGWTFAFMADYCPDHRSQNEYQMREDEIQAQRQRDLQLRREEEAQEARSSVQALTELALA